MQDKTPFKLNFDLKDIPFEKYEKDFTFIVNGKEYQTNRLFADILSPKIRKLHYVDRSIDSFVINVDANFDFNEILSLLSSDEKQINKEKAAIYSKIFIILENKDAYLKLFPKNAEESNISNVFEQIRSKKQYLSLFSIANDKSKIYEEDIYLNNEIIQPEIDFIAKHFYDIDLEELKTLGTTVIELVINNSNLRLPDEDYLLQFVLDLYSNNSKMSNLFHYVDFLNVSNEELLHFHEKFDLNDVNGLIWNKIIERASKYKIQSTVETDFNRYVQNFKHDPNKEFEGIIKFLTKKTGGNIHDNGTIKVTTNYLNSSFPPKNLLDFSGYSQYLASNPNDAWVCFDFKNYSVNLSKYSIRSYKDGPNQYHLKNWVIETSKDGEHWEVIDDRKNCSTLNGNYLVGTFDVKPNCFSRYIRLRQTGELWGDGKMWFHYIEFYGLLKN